MSTYTLPERCDRASAEDLLARLRQSQGARFEIDASRVVQIGQAMIQVLVSACRSSDAVILGASSSLCDTARLLGLTEVLFKGEPA